MTTSNPALWNQFATRLPNIVWVNDDSGNITYINDKWYEFTGLNQENGLGFGWQAVVHPADAAAYVAQFPLTNQSRSTNQADIRIKRHDGVYRRFVCTMKREADNVWIGCATELHDQPAASLSDAAQGKILDMVVNGTPLPEVLIELCRAAEQQLPEATCSVLLIDSQRQVFIAGYATELLSPSLVNLKGAAIGPDVGSCGAAGYLRQDVFTPDIASDPNWTQWKGLVLPLGLKACWSLPVFAADGDVIASLGFYFRDNVTPSTEVRNVLTRLRGLASIAIERAMMMDALRESEEHYRHTVEQIPQIPWTADPNGQLLSVSSRWTGLTGIPAEDALGTGWLNAVHPDDVEMTFGNWEQAHADGKSCDIYYRILTVNGEYRWVRARANPRYAEDGSLLKWYGTLEDVHDQHVLHEKLKYHAYHDELTSLYNRRKFQEDLQSRLHIECASVGLMLMDLDDFKLINDRYGHQMGDAMLRLFSEHIQNQLEPGEEVYRLGGDEFAVIARNLTEDAPLLARATAIGANLKAKLSRNKKTLFCTPSIGCTIGFSKESSDDVFKRADLALYSAKGSGKGNVKLYTTSIRSVATRRSEAFELAGTALQNNWIVPYYQPLVALKSGEIVGFEALLRINHPDNGLIMPAGIQYSLEDPRLANALYERMRQLVVDDLAYCTQKAIPIGQVALNLSTENLLDPQFAQNILAALADKGVPASVLKIEITERVFIERIKQSAMSNLALLRDNGVDVSLDDFGTGYASLIHLKSLPIRELKIDRSFVSGLGSEANQGEIVSAMLGLSQMLKLRTVAEGIETQEEADTLIQWGCDLGQGYLYGRPAPFHDAVRAALAQQAV